MTAYQILALAAIVLFAVAAVMIARTSFGPRQKILDRLLEQERAQQPDAMPGHRRARLAVTEFLAGLPVFAPSQRVDVQRRLITAGHRGTGAMAAVVALSLLSALVGMALAALALWSPRMPAHWALRIPALLAAAWVGMLLPRLVLDRLVARHRRAVLRGLPDALDLMIICTNAGMGLNATLQRVALEMASIAPALADELALTSAEAQLSGDTTAALTHMAERLDIPSITSLAATLSQAQRYGTPVTQALRVLASTERRTRLLMLEEKAGKLGTKITFPMMLFILPPVLIISAGPTIIQLIESLK